MSSHPENYGGGKEAIWTKPDLTWELAQRVEIGVNEDLLSDFCTSETMAVESLKRLDLHFTHERLGRPEQVVTELGSMQIVEYGQFRATTFNLGGSAIEAMSIFVDLPAIEEATQAGLELDSLRFKAKGASLNRNVSSVVAHELLHHREYVLGKKPEPIPTKIAKFGKNVMSAFMIEASGARELEGRLRSLREERMVRSRIKEIFSSTDRFYSLIEVQPISDNR